MDAQTKAPTWQLTARGAACPPPPKHSSGRPAPHPAQLPAVLRKLCTHWGLHFRPVFHQQPPQNGCTAPSGSALHPNHGREGKREQGRRRRGAAGCCLPKKTLLLLLLAAQHPPLLLGRAPNPPPPAVAAPLQPPKLQPRPRRTCTGHPARQHQRMELVQPLISCHR